MMPLKSQISIRYLLVTTMERSQNSKKNKADAFLKACPSRKILARVGDKWSVLIILSLKDEPIRFGALLRKVEGISQKMLTQNLRNLERDGLIMRKIYNETPLRVEYRLAPMSMELTVIMQSLKKWAEYHYKRIENYQEKFDNR
jgi:DNA-binding HxlR family transcriptional regulator